MERGEKIWREVVIRPEVIEQERANPLFLLSSP